MDRQMPPLTALIRKWRTKAQPRPEAASALHQEASMARRAVYRECANDLFKLLAEAEVSRAQNGTQAEGNATATYARVEWTPEDVLDHKPDWTLEQATAWLSKHQRQVRDRVTELGHEVLTVLLALDERRS